MEHFLITMLISMLPQMTQEVRDGVLKWLDDLEAQANKTPNPWDNIFVFILRILLGVKSGTSAGNSSDT